jgi:proteasome lid subunit RPN8/RPN11
MLLKPKKKPAFGVSISREALEAIFDECDKYDADETGGRLLGTYRERGTGLEIDVSGVLEPGPNAERSATHFFQDGEHQERLFRAIEAQHPEIEHLGNWHTHHVNGLPTLSGGDKDTYFRTVNHGMHNTDFFYALLVTRKNRGTGPRYAIKHFLFRRNDQTVYEIPNNEVRVLDKPRVRAPAIDAGETAKPPIAQPKPGAPHPERAKDQDFFSDFYPELRPLVSRSTGAPYWKGPVELIDGSRAEVVAVESVEGPALSYSIATSATNPVFTDVVPRCRERHFRSARHAVLHLERELNQALYRSKG